MSGNCGGMARYVRRKRPQCSTMSLEVGYKQIEKHAVGNRMVQDNELKPAEPRPSTSIEMRQLPEMSEVSLGAGPPHHQSQSPAAASSRMASSACNIQHGKGATPLKESYCGQASLACFVLFLCNPVFGAIAFILAVMADGSQGNHVTRSRQYGSASIAVSVAGIVVSGFVVIIIIGILAKQNFNHPSICIGFFQLKFGYPMHAWYFVPNANGSTPDCAYSVFNDCYDGGRPVPPSCLISKDGSSGNSCCKSNEFYSDGYCYYRLDK